MFAGMVKFNDLEGRKRSWIGMGCKQSDCLKPVVTAAGIPDHKEIRPTKESLKMAMIPQTKTAK